jgi:hypothetical protein
MQDLHVEDCHSPLPSSCQVNTYIMHAICAVNALIMQHLLQIRLISSSADFGLCA